MKYFCIPHLTNESPGYQASFSLYYIILPFKMPKPLKKKRQKLSYLPFSQTPPLSIVIFKTIFVYVLFLLSGLHTPHSKLLPEAGKSSRLPKIFMKIKQQPKSPQTQRRSGSVPELPPSKGLSKQSRSRRYTFSAPSRSSAPTPTSHGQSTFFVPTPQLGGKVDD